MVGSGSGLFGEDGSPEEEADDVAVELVQHLFKEFEGFKFVDEERVFLFVDGGLDGLTEVVHFAEVVHPVFVDECEDDGAFKGVEDFASPGLVGFFQVHDAVYDAESVGERYDDFFDLFSAGFVEVLDGGPGLLCHGFLLALVDLCCAFVDSLCDFVGFEVLEFFFGDGGLDREGSEDVHGESCVVFFFFGAFGDGVCDVLEGVVDVDCESIAEECVSSSCIDGFALCVHDVVVL